MTIKSVSFNDVRQNKNHHESMKKKMMKRKKKNEKQLNNALKSGDVDELMDMDLADYENF